MQEIQIANELYKQQKNNPFSSSNLSADGYKKVLDENQKELEELFNITKNDLDFILRRLTSTGLVVPFTRRGMKNWDVVPYEITTTFRKIAQYLEGQPNAQT